MTRDEPLAQSAPLWIEVATPRGPIAPLVVSSPHSGTIWPEPAARRLAAPTEIVRQLEDGPVDVLADGMRDAGAFLISARFARGVVDPNRDVLEVDTDLVTGPPGPVRLSAKVRAGLGVVPSRVAGRALYAAPLHADELRWRLDSMWRPYHGALKEAVDACHRRFGRVLLLDLHSMPSEHGGEGGPVDVALGDRFGRACHPAIVSASREILAAAGLVVARNRPYAGGYITEHYGRPGEYRYAMQVEVRRGLFMSERDHAPTDGFRTIQALLTKLALRLREVVIELPSAAAAE